MSVLLPNASLGLRHRVEGKRNAHGQRMPDGYGDFHGPHDGRVNEQSDGTWALALDPDLWPVRQGDLVISTTGGSWLVTTSDLIRNSYDPYVDYVRVTANHRSGGGTEPGGAWFVARYTEGVDQTPESSNLSASGFGDSSSSTPEHIEAHLWTGYGPPPDADFGALPGDEYIDLLTGIIYELE